MTDLQRLMRAVRIIAKLAWKYRQQDVAAALMKHCTKRERGDAYFIGTYLDDVFQLNRKAEHDAEQHCCECGDSVHERKDRDARSDARYCSPKCRTRAYRKRVTTNRSPNRCKRHAAPPCDGSPPAESDLTVTQGDAP
jgi:hypothetical protein